MLFLLEDSHVDRMVEEKCLGMKPTGAQQQQWLLTGLSQEYLS